MSEAKLKAATEGVAKAFDEAGIGNDLNLMLGAVGIMTGTLCASFPDKHQALRVINKIAKSIMKGVDA